MRNGLQRTRRLLDMFLLVDEIDARFHVARGSYDRSVHYKMFHQFNLMNEPASRTCRPLSSHSFPAIALDPICLQNSCRRFAVLCLAVAVAWPTAHAAKATKPSPENPEVSEKKSDLRDLREKIDTLQKRTSRQRRIARRSRRPVEGFGTLDLAVAARTGELGDERGQLQGTLRELGTQARSLEAQIAAQQAQLADLLYQQYLRGAPIPCSCCSTATTPTRWRATCHYIDIIAQARINLLQQIEANLRKRDIAARTGPRQLSSP